MKTTVLVGGGRITSALVAGLRLASYRPPIIVHDHHPRKLSELKRQHGVIIELDLQRAVEQAHLLIIAVRPDLVMELLASIGRIDHAVTAVSLAAGIPLSQLRRQSGTSLRWVRAMPSPVCRTGRELTALAFDRGFPRNYRQEVKGFFANVGCVLEIAEHKFDAFTAAYSCSHGYHALATLAGAASKLGLDRKTALAAAGHALADGIVAWREGETALVHLLNEAATPGGIAASVMISMDQAGYRRIVEEGLRSGMALARKNAKR